MDELHNNEIDLNLAELEALTDIPGISAALAERIVGGRPYSSIEDLKSVRGIGPVFLDRIRPYVAVNGSVKKSTSKKLVPGDKELKRKPPKPKSVRETTPPDTNSETITRSEALWLSGGSALIAIIATLILTLGILGGINGGLRFIRPGEFAQLSRQAETFSSDLFSLETELGDLRTRLDTLETLSGRMTTVENDLETIQSVSSNAAEQVAAMEVELDVINENLEGLNNDVSIFQTFLDGLRVLLMENTVDGGDSNDN